MRAIVTIAQIQKLAVILLAPKCWRGLLAGVGASVEHRAVLRQMNALSCRTIVDVGANKGQFALAATAWVPKANIYSFEPLNGPARKFRMLFRKAPFVHLYQVAIGPAPCTTDAHISGRDDSSSLLPINTIQEKTFPGTGEVGLERIKVDKLCNVINRHDIVSPALLKLDVQGFELEALKGSLEVLPQFDYVYVECSFMEFYVGQPMASHVIAFLERHHFEMCGIYNLSYDRDGRPLQGDFIFRSLGATRTNSHKIINESTSQTV